MSIKLHAKDRKMGSWEIVDAGKLAGGKSNFSKTCSLLSQYLKEKGSFGDLSLGLAHKFESIGAPPPAAAGTMNLFPIMENFGETQLPLGEEETQLNFDLSGAKVGGSSAQLTIFYGGQVLVFDDFPAEKVTEIMGLAHKSGAGAAQNYHSDSFAPPIKAQSPSESATSIPNLVPSFGIPEHAHYSPMPSLDSDLPIARRNSLARFLEKRKDRIKEQASYQAIKPASTALPAGTEASPGFGAV